MDYLFDNWNKINKCLKEKNIYLFLDYDGTLSPIAETPEKAILREETKELLLRLSKNPRFKIAIMSGRPLQDIRNQVKIRGIIYAGNHGLAIQGPNNINYKTRIPLKTKTILKKIKNDLNKRLSSIKGIIVEDKGLSLALHYRLVEKKCLPKVITAFQKTITSYLTKGEIRLRHGKMVLEAAPAADWNKGNALLWLLAKEKAASKNRDIIPVYIGDDETDEDAFKVLKDNGLTVVVGKSTKSYAKYYVKNSKDVIKFLEALCGN